MISHAKSKALFAEALKFILGGVNSPVRAFRAVGGQRFFVNNASGGPLHAEVYFCMEDLKIAAALRVSLGNNGDVNLELAPCVAAGVSGFLFIS